MTEITEETIRAAQIYDWANRGTGQNWQRVPHAQVARLIRGAVEAERERAKRETGQAVRDTVALRFESIIREMTDETMAARLAEVEAAVRADERRRIRELADESGAVCTAGDWRSHPFAGLLAEPARTSPGQLWEQAGGNPDEYRRLLREHGHILRPGDVGYDPDAPRTLPCGWSPDNAKPGGGNGE